MVSGAASDRPEVTDLALGHELAHGADRLLNRRVGVDAVLVVEVDVVDTQPEQRAVAGLAHVLGPAVDGAPGRIVRVTHDAELGGDDRLVAVPGQRLADEQLVGVRPVHVGGVEEGDPELERTVDGGGGLVVVDRPVEVGHPHAAEALAGDRETLGPERDRFDGHGVAPLVMSPRRSALAGTGPLRVRRAPPLRVHAGPRTASSRLPSTGCPVAASSSRRRVYAAESMSWTHMTRASCPVTG